LVNPVIEVSQSTEVHLVSLLVLGSDDGPGEDDLRDL
jgi:hypothetical protein